MAGDYRRQLIDQIKNRALVYADVYDTLCEALGEADAERLLAKAIERRGRAAGRALVSYAPKDFAGLRDAFLRGVPGEGELFSPTVAHCDAGGLEIDFGACPLKDAWREAGCDDAKVATLCRIAGAIDRGMFESAGFAIVNHTWKAGEAGCCRLRISAVR